MNCERGRERSISAWEAEPTATSFLAQIQLIAYQAGQGAVIVPSAVLFSNHISTNTAQIASQPYVSAAMANVTDMAESLINSPHNH